jgi:L-fucose mutarotase
MLKGIDPLLNAELLEILASMGHGDELAIVDRNFPAVSFARRLVRLSGVDVSTVATAIFSVLPVDSYVDQPLTRMEVVGDPSVVTPVQQEFLDIAQRAEGRHLSMGSLERFAFYRQASSAFAIVATGEARGYGNFLISKGGVA